MIDARFTNRSQGCEWYTCDRCGVDYPRTAVRVQNGQILCGGSNTNHCAEDEIGYSANLKKLELPREQPFAPLEQETVDL